MEENFSGANSENEKDKEIARLAHQVSNLTEELRAERWKAHRETTELRDENLRQLQSRIAWEQELGKKSEEASIRASETATSVLAKAYLDSIQADKAVVDSLAVTQQSILGIGIEAERRHETIKRKLSETANDLTSQTCAVKNDISRVTTATHMTDERSEERYQLTADQLEGLASGLKNLATRINQPSRLSQLFSWMRRHRARHCSCSYRSVRRNSDLWCKPSDVEQRQNGVIIIHGKSDSSMKMAGKVLTVFQDEKFFALKPTIYDEQLPHWDGKHSLSWLVVFAILQEGQRTRDVEDVIKTIMNYLKNETFQQCKKLVIIQCKWLPSGDLMTPLRSLRNATGIIVEAKDYCERVIKKHMESHTSFENVVKRIKEDAKVRPKCILKD